MLFVFLIMLTASNIFIAILTDAYTRKKGQIEKYKRYKKMLRAEGTNVQSTANVSAQFKKLTKLLFPKYMLQLPPVLWPRPEDVGVQSVFEVEQEGEGGGARMVCLHYMHESLDSTGLDDGALDAENKEDSKEEKARKAWERARRLRRTKQAMSQRTLVTNDIEAGPADLPPDDCALYGHERAVYIKIHSLQMQQLVSNQRHARLSLSDFTSA
eukprot:SAG11_NODE_1436_length_4909_cov_3.825780_11_plen_213_part_00